MGDHKMALKHKRRFGELSHDPDLKLTNAALQEEEIREADLKNDLLDKRVWKDFVDRHFRHASRKERSN